MCSEPHWKSGQSLRDERRDPRQESGVIVMLIDGPQFYYSIVSKFLIHSESSDVDYHQRFIYIKVRQCDDRFSIIFRKSEMKWQDNYPDENRSRKPGQVASVITNRNGPLALSTRTRMIPMPAPGHSSHTLTHLLPSHIIISSTEPGVTNVKITCHHLQPGSCQCLVTSLRPGPRPGNSCLCSVLRTLSPRNPDDSPIHRGDRQLFCSCILSTSVN